VRRPPGLNNSLKMFLNAITGPDERLRRTRVLDDRRHEGIGHDDGMDNRRGNIFSGQNGLMLDQKGCILEESEVARLLL